MKKIWNRTWTPVGSIMAVLPLVMLGCASEAPTAQSHDEKFASAQQDLCAAGGLVSDDADYVAAAGELVNWTASASCQLANPQYEFWWQRPGEGWLLLQPWSTANTYAWDTTGAAEGTYNWQVWVREAGSQEVLETWAGHGFTVSNGACATVTTTTTPNGHGAPGAPVAIASGADCTNAEYEVWHQPPNGAWEVLQPYATASTYNWNTTGAVTGDHLFEVWIRKAGTQSTYDAYNYFSYHVDAPCSAVSESFDPPGPASIGDDIKVTAAGSCDSDAEYKFWILPANGAFTMVQDWSPSNTYSWDTTGLTPGDYSFQTWVRSAGSSGSYEAWTGHTYTLAAACDTATIDLSPSSPAQAGTIVTVSGGASTCPAPTYQFWLLSPSGSFQSVQAYGVGSSYRWDTTGLTPGDYSFQVWARQSGSNASFQTWAGKTFTVQ